MAKAFIAAAAALVALAGGVAAEPLAGQGREITQKGLTLLCVNKAQDSSWGKLLTGSNPQRVCGCTAERVSAALSKEDVIGIIGGEIKVKEDARLKGLLERAALACSFKFR
ncbi:hypothetical protein EV683_11647 [Crenobacter luteus]|uniref:Uncharacterized protein n=1 Tax=Crenobacter luteus TaxID=1452487 RepID=A0A163C4L8_9NEIS|nr:hypothetical protein [Crenobacter luteus]KZE30046.1 hypothetical protein AVW16_13010 [Crenobacter luteus]TCP11018.1 hypothetical protein EV683_11647 [Crenobacter luteus]